jgi:hypothetical protein
MKVLLPLLFLRITTIIECLIAFWGLAAIIFGSNLDNSYWCIPKYSIPKTAKTCQVSLLLFTSGALYGIAALGVAFVEESQLLCDIFVRSCVVLFVVNAMAIYMFMLVKARTAKVDLEEKSVLEKCLTVALYGIPAFIPVAAYYLPGNLFSVSDDDFSQAFRGICLVDTLRWEIFASFTFFDWAFNFGFFFLFFRSLQDVISMHRNTNGSQSSKRALSLVKIAKKNFIACLICIIPSSFLFCMIMLPSRANLDQLVFSAWAQTLVPITISSFMISAIYSTSRGYEIRSNSLSSSRGKEQPTPTPNISKESKQNHNVSASIAIPEPQEES